MSATIINPARTINMRRTCRVCRWFNTTESTCQRLPPQVVSTKTPDGRGGWYPTTQTQWPTVWNENWCGEHKFDKYKFAEAVLK